MQSMHETAYKPCDNSCAIAMRGPSVMVWYSDGRAARMCSNTERLLSGFFPGSWCLCVLQREAPKPLHNPPAGRAHDCTQEGY